MTLIIDNVFTRDALLQRLYDADNAFEADDLRVAINARIAVLLDRL